MRLPSRVLLATAALVAGLIAGPSRGAALAQEGHRFEETPIVGVTHKPLIEVLVVRQDVTTSATVPLPDAPLLPKVTASVAAPVF